MREESIPIWIEAERQGRSVSFSSDLGPKRKRIWNRWRLSRAETQLASQCTGILFARRKEIPTSRSLPTLACEASIEKEKFQLKKWHSGIAFYVSVDGLFDPRFIYGSVGTAGTRTEARISSLEEWYSIFVPTFFRAISADPERIHFDGLDIFASDVIMRGERPSAPQIDWKDLWRMLIKPYIRIVKKTYLRGTQFMPDTHTLQLSIFVDKLGGRDGEVRLNGQELPIQAECVSNLPMGTKDYMLKMFCIVRCPRLEGETQSF